MEAKAIAKGIRISPQKARYVIDLIRNKSVMEAYAILKNTNNRAALPTYKCLDSAVANAENNLGLKREDLFIKECYINEGRTFKRYRMASRSNVDRNYHRHSHITIVVWDKNENNEKQVKEEKPAKKEEKASKKVEKKETKKEAKKETPKKEENNKKEDNA